MSSFHGCWLDTTARRNTAAFEEVVVVNEDTQPTKSATSSKRMAAEADDEL